MPIVYALPSQHTYPFDPTQIQVDSNPSPRLIKYGFNIISEGINIMTLTANPYYTTGLSFDFTRDDDQSIVTKASKSIGIKNLSRAIAELWEVFTVFKLGESDKKIYTNIPKGIEIILNAQQKLSKTKDSHQIISTSDRKSKSMTADLVIMGYSDVDLDENAVVRLIIQDLENVLNLQIEGSSMILQIFGLQTAIQVELITYLATMYREVYIYRPVVANDLSQVKYLVLINFQVDPDLSSKIEWSGKIYDGIKGKKDDLYLTSIGIRVPESFSSVIQCLNGQLLPELFAKYNSIGKYLEAKIFEGSVYREMIDNQNRHTDEWLDTFALVEPAKLLDVGLKKSAALCLWE